MQGTVTAGDGRPLALGRLCFPPADPADKIEPFQCGMYVDRNIRNSDEKGRFLEAVTVLAVSPDRERVFVKWYRTGDTAWMETDRLADH